MKELTGQQIEFAKLVVMGASLADAYRKSFDCKDKSTDAINKAAQRLSKNVLVLEFMDRMRNDKQQEAIMTKRERMEWLTRVVRTPLAQVTESSDLCQKYSEMDNGNGYSRKVEMPSKIAAIAEMNRMDGAYEPDKVEVSGALGIGAVVAALQVGEAEPLVRQ